MAWHSAAGAQGNPEAKAIIKQLSPEERKKFDSMNRQQKQAFIRKKLEEKKSGGSSEKPAQTRAKKESKQPASSGATASAGWQGPMIDAHSQAGCDVRAEEVRAAITKNGMTHTLLSGRGCRGEGASATHERVLDLVESLGGRASFLISMKLEGMSMMEGRFTRQGLAAINQADKAHFANAVGFAEIIVQHAPHVTQRLKHEGVALDLGSERIAGAIAVVLARKVPVILHVELNDSEDKSQLILRQLKELLTKNPDNPFVLIHMGQASVEEARDLIENHANIHFLTTASDAISAAGVTSLRRKGESAQSGWINMFNDPPEGAPYKGWIQEFVPSLRWRDDWKALIEAHPDRFVFAMERVFANHWNKHYVSALKYWRAALAKLSPETARRVACGNARRLWRLDVDCGG
ncbi:MAG: amidohydrolase family protein [Rhodospirillales bacterium]|nr:amidohydrolase family protein [Rhodospirillales bacterium]